MLLQFDENKALRFKRFGNKTCLQHSFENFLMGNTFGIDSQDAVIAI
jgi:hypothetical protein